MAYYKQNVHLTDGQAYKLDLAARKHEPVTLRINPSKKGNVDLYLTQRQINKLKDGNTHDLQFSKTQLAKNGGLIITIPTLLAGISAAAAAAGAASNIAKAVNQKKHETKMEHEHKRHNSRVEQLLKASKKGQGAFLPKKKY